MKTSNCCKLIETLREFNAEEFREFELIATSPFFGTGRNYTPYLKVLKKQFPRFDSEMMLKKNARRHIFEITHPGKPYRDQYMKNIFSDLSRFAEETLFQRVVRKYSHTNQIFLIMEETKKSLFHLAKHNLSHLDKKFDKEGMDEIYFFHRGMNELIKSIFINKISKKNYESGLLLNTGTSFLFFSVVSMALSIYNISLRRVMLNIPDDSEQLIESFSKLVDYDKLEKLLLNSDDKDKKIILFFVYYLNHSKGQTGFSNYKKMRDIIFYEYGRFKPKMLFLLCNILKSTLYEISDSIDAEKFNKEYHTASIFVLRHSCYKSVKSSSFQFTKFRSVFNNALALGKTDWIKKFTAKYSPELSPEVRDEMVSIINANIKFECGNYDEALKELNNIRISQLLLKFDSGILKLKLYFEKNNYIQASETLDALSRLIRTDKILSDKMKQGFVVFTKYYKILLDTVNLKFNEPEMILKEIQTTPSFTEKRWIIEKFEKPL